MRLKLRSRVLNASLRIVIAAMAGVARESVSRTLREWQRQKILQGSSRTGYVVNMPSLVGVATE